jgi:3-phenylpropionate/cinnamic acid dioxygenase small subunit
VRRKEINPGLGNRDSGLFLRLEVEQLYAEYASCLDAGELERWPELFVDDCVYKIVPRENFDRGLPLALMLCESGGMLRDRVQTIRRTSVFVPRSLRHFVSSLRVAEDGDAVRVEASFLVVQTQADEETRVFVAGQYRDRLVRRDGQLRFAEKICILDSNLIPGSLIVPV